MAATMQTRTSPSEHPELRYHASGSAWDATRCQGWVYLTDEESARLYRPDGYLRHIEVRSEARLATDAYVYEVAERLGLRARDYQGAWDILERHAKAAERLWDAAWEDDDEDEPGDLADYDVLIHLQREGFHGAVVYDHAPEGDDHETLILWAREMAR